MAVRQSPHCRTTADAPENTPYVPYGKTSLTESTGDHHWQTDAVANRLPVERKANGAGGLLPLF
jgi:hypothetical protein